MLLNWVLGQFGGSRNMEALLLSMIQKLDTAETAKNKKKKMESVIKEMREIVDIVRDKKLEQERSLNFLVSDLVDLADEALHLYEQGKTYVFYYESIYSWIGEIKRRMIKLGDDESNMRLSENVDDKYKIGLDNDVEMLLSTRIIGGGEYLKTVLIKGMCGIGKTTLAREIYNHTTVVERFERRAWVSNSTHLTIKELLIKLIQQIAVEDPQNLHTSSLLENMDNPSLRDMLFQHLRGKRYLIVLDDMPKQMHLKSFLEALPQEFNGSRLLFTSHMTHINIRVGDEDVHQMKPLDPNNSWKLFLKTIRHGNKLTGKHKFPTSLVHMGKQMLRKCGGVPLAIKEVGKRLLEKKLTSGSEWEQLLESVDFGPTLKLLEPFYHKLDPKLETCFLSMAFFKENTTLREEKLSHILIAGGVVDSTYRLKSSLDDLVNESFIGVGNKRTEYRLNALLHMLSIQKAEEKISFEILRNNGNNRPSQSPRHRVIICSRDKFNYFTDQDKHLVSLFFHGGGYFDTSLSYWKSFELLKILDLEDFGLKILLVSIGTLIELRYLGLRNNYLKVLPESLGRLKKLEVLNIAQNLMVEVPDVIWKMDSLVHIYMSDVIFRKLLMIDKLRNLETLTYISVDNWTYELSSLKVFTHLEKWGIEELDGNSDVRKLFETLANMSFLKHLILRGYRFRSMPSLDELGILQSVNTLKLDGLLDRLPTNLPPNIRSLTLIDSCLAEDPMPQLEKLPKLKYLKLRNAYTGQQMVILPNGFCLLQVMCIEELWNLREVKCGEDAMYNLKKLEIHDCPFLDTLSEMIESILYLKEIKMVTTKSIAAKINNSYLLSKVGIANINQSMS